MIRLNGKTSSRSSIRKQKTWLAGEIADKGSYVCVHCSTHTAMEHSGYLPPCRGCFGRRFKQL